MDVSVPELGATDVMLELDFYHYLLRVVLLFLP